MSAYTGTNQNNGQYSRQQQGGQHIDVEYDLGHGRQLTGARGTVAGAVLHLHPRGPEGRGIQQGGGDCQAGDQNLGLPTLTYESDRRYMVDNDIMFKCNHSDQPHRYKATDKGEEHHCLTHSVVVDDGNSHHVQPRYQDRQHVDTGGARKRSQVEIGRVQTEVFRSKYTCCKKVTQETNSTDSRLNV